MEDFKFKLGDLVRMRADSKYGRHFCIIERFVGESTGGRFLAYGIRVEMHHCVVVREIELEVHTPDND